ncbi:concanavalin A-like lectin/glucanase [Thozetella sp. PMI_491]|nr:concanavalin A-like lectin/glucanase [Thozetella sp. PMI_491]
MKTFAAFLLGAVSLPQLIHASVEWSFKTFQDGVEIGTALGPQTELQTNVMQRVQEARKEKRLTAAESSSNWCGAAQTTTGTFKSVVGSWKVPTISLRSGQTNSQQPSIAQWVGIDGFSNSALIQGGTLTQISSSGSQSTFAWVEMLPAALHSVSLTVSSGDSITTNVTMTSTTSGSITIHNTSKGTSVTGNVSGGTTLQGKSAEWILEDVSSGGGLVPFASFPSGTTFTGNDAILSSGSTVTADGATLINIVQNSELCSATESGNVISMKPS